MLKRNLISNYLGQCWVTLMGLMFIPLYIKYLGIEAYGLIGLFAVLQTCLSLLDMGMTPTLSREMARFTGGAHSVNLIRDLLRSVELLALAMAVLIMFGLWSASSWLARDWLRAENLPLSLVEHAIAIMGVVIALRFVESIYRSSIVGLQRQVLFNLVSTTMATIRGLGAVAILAWISPTIQAFFIWQGLISLVTLAALAIATYGVLPAGDRGGRFSLHALRSIGRFASGMVGITFLSLLLTQVDKILLSKLLSLSEYGYYTLAALVASVVFMLSSPIVQAWFPRLSELIARNDQTGLIKTYHLGAQLGTVIVGSAAVVLIVFAETFLHLWTQDAELAHRAATLVSVLTLGNLLNALLWIPFQAQLAHGWTGLAVRVNIISVIIIVPSILWTAPRYGAEGAAWVWVILNAGYVLIGMHVMYRRILTAEKWNWYRQDILQPILGAIAATLLVRWVVPLTTTVIEQFAKLALASVLTLAAAAIAAPLIRQRIRNAISM